MGIVYSQSLRTVNISFLMNFIPQMGRFETVYSLICCTFFPTVLCSRLLCTLESKSRSILLPRKSKWKVHTNWMKINLFYIKTLPMSRQEEHNMTVWWISDPLTYLRKKNNEQIKISFPEIKEFYRKMSGMKKLLNF